MLKHRVRANFNQAAESYAKAADVQREVAQSLSERIAVDAPPFRLVDAGCGTGFASDLLARRWPEAERLNIDFAPAMLKKLPAGDTGLCADVEALPLAPASVDLYFSSFTLQWCDLARAFAEAYRVLTPGGTLAFSLPTTDTFRELRAAFNGLDAHAHTLEIPPPEAVAEAVRKAGFSGITQSRDVISSRHPDLKSLLRSIKAVGAQGVSGQRRPGLFGKYAWMSVEAQYPRTRGPNGKTSLAATYDVLYLTARK
jgi:malonyl-CoA O-methyltransferase